MTKNKAQIRRKTHRGVEPSVPDGLLAAALCSQSEGVLLLRRKGSPEGFRIAFANDGFCEMTGYEPAELEGLCHGMLHTNRAELFRMATWDEAGDSSVVYMGEGELLCRDGHALHASWSFSLVEMGKGAPSHIVASYRDMTEKHKLQEALTLSQKLDAVGRMAGGVAHDFNNLISVITSYSQMLASRCAGQPELAHDVEEIMKAGQKAAALTRQLLALGRSQPLALRPLELNGFLRANSEMLSRVVGDAGVLELSLHEGGLVAKTDADQLRQVLLNLVLNARDALRDKGRVVLGTSLREMKDAKTEHGIPPGRYAVLSVADNGMGMTTETLAHIFEPFFTTKDESKGSGLGLALVYGIIQQSGGFIRVNSTLLLGSTFDLWLPLSDLPVAQPSTEDAAPPARSARQGRESILLVEGDAVLAKMIGGLFTTDGYRVCEASSVQQARELLAASGAEIDLVIASLGDSAECRTFVEELRASRGKVRLVCTAPCGERCPLAQTDEPCQVSLPRPFLISELINASKKLLSKPTGM